jgi:hypothetical protein
VTASDPILAQLAFDPGVSLVGANIVSLVHDDTDVMGRARAVLCSRRVRQ